MLLFIDTESTGLPTRRNAHYTDHGAWPRLVSISWVLFRSPDQMFGQQHHIIRPEGFVIPGEATAIHGITTERARSEGKPLRLVLTELLQDVEAHRPEILVAHNIAFDRPLILAELSRSGIATGLEEMPTCCTMTSATDYCAIPGARGYKWPKLDELYRKLFNADYPHAHDAAADVLACARCYFRLVELGVVQKRR